jgi:hypothetical protein
LAERPIVKNKPSVARPGGRATVLETFARARWRDPARLRARKYDLLL